MDQQQPYYLAYEQRYQKVYAAGGNLWGHTPDDETLSQTLERWVDAYQLRGKRIIEFACGEGASGVILSRLGCIYHGVDIAPSAVNKARQMVRDFPDATVSQCDMIHTRINETYDAALDVMGFHMLITDADRRGYLANAYGCLKSNAPMLFYKQMHTLEEPAAAIASYEQWIDITKQDHVTPRQMYIHDGDTSTEIWLPYVPGRSRSKDGYLCEMQGAGFVVDDIVSMGDSRQCPDSVNLFVHKP